MDVVSSTQCGLSGDLLHYFVLITFVSLVNTVILTF